MGGWVGVDGNCLVTSMIGITITIIIIVEPFGSTVRLCLFSEKYN